MRTYHVYILASLSKRLYIGVTNSLLLRTYEHKQGAMPGFTQRYRINRLVYFEETSDIRAAITREKQLKRWPRERKLRLIEATNPEWRDLSVDWYSNHEPRPAPSLQTVDPDTRGPSGAAPAG